MFQFQIPKFIVIEKPKLIIIAYWMFIIKERVYKFSIRNYLVKRKQTIGKQLYFGYRKS